MPIYEYQCTACGQIVEKWQKFSDPPLTVCPRCGGSVSKLISNCAFHLKGSGWYVTDYGGSRQTASKPESSSGGKGSATPESGKSEPSTSEKNN